MSSRNKTWCKRMRSAVLKVLRTISGYWSGLLQDLPPFIYKQKANVVVTVIQVAWKSGRHDWEANMWDSLGHDAWSVKQTWTPACWMQLRTQDSWTRNGMVLNKIQHPLCFLFFHIPLSTRYEIIAVTPCCLESLVFPPPEQLHRPPPHTLSSRMPALHCPSHRRKNEPIRGLKNISKVLFKEPLQEGVGFLRWGNREQIENPLGNSSLGCLFPLWLICVGEADGA